MDKGRFFNFSGRAVSAYWRGRADSYRFASRASLRHRRVDNRRRDLLPPDEMAAWQRDRTDNLLVVVSLGLRH